MNRPRRGHFWRRGEPMVWATGAALAAMLAMVVLLVGVVAYNGLGVFWPKAVVELSLADGGVVLGEFVRRQANPDTGAVSIQLKTGNRELTADRQDFRWVEETKVRSRARPHDVWVVERLENGNLYGRLVSVAAPTAAAADGAAEAQLAAALAAVGEQAEATLAPIGRRLAEISQQLAAVGRRIAKVQYAQRQLAAADAGRRQLETRLGQLRREANELKTRSDELVAEQHRHESLLRSNVALFRTAEGGEARVPLLEIVRHYRPNAMGIGSKLGHYALRLGELFWANPRESNTEGGLFPAIFGTVMLVFLMAVACFPLGVLAGIYLGEYARDGFLLRLVRVAVNNLAGIPSIVYGIFGLGFFVYGIGGLLDHWLFPERVAAGAPTFGTGGILWASLTLGLLTIPVVIVATEESLRVVPRGLHEASMALGATRCQTLVRVLLPAASPGIITGFILAMSRAAGEVAPLMITGVVKLAPEMPVDGQFPFFHLDRKFMHLGFHIFDIGFQSPNVEASKPMVYVTTMLLLVLVLAMTGVAIYLRNRLRRKYQARTV